MRWVAASAGLVAFALSPGIQAAEADSIRLVIAIKERNLSAASRLIDQRSGINSAWGDGTTPLHWSSHWNYLELTSRLIQAGASVNAKDDLGVTPLALACLNGSAAMVRRLLDAGANPNLSRGNGETPLMTCSRTGNSEAVVSLLSHGADVNARENSHGQTALMWAISRRHGKVASALIQSGADVNARSSVTQEFVARMMPPPGKKTPLDAGVWMPRGGSTPLLFAARVGDIEGVQLLLKAGVDINQTAPDGNTALLIAAQSGHGALAGFLLDRGADPNAAGIGYTALHSAVLRADAMLIRALLVHGANPNATLTNGTPIRRTDPDGLLPLDYLGATPIWLAGRFLEPRLMEILAAAGADIRIPIHDRTTPLMAAAGVGWDSGFERRGAYIVGADVPKDGDRALETIRVAISLGADVKETNNRGETALHGAASKAYVEVARRLVQTGANPDAKDKAGQTPLDMAQRQQSAAYQPLITLLSERGAPTPQ